MTISERRSLLEKMCTIEKRLQTSTKAEESSAFMAHASTTKSQSLAIKTTLSKPSGSKKAPKTIEKTAAVFIVVWLAI